MQVRKIVCTFVAYNNNKNNTMATKYIKVTLLGENTPRYVLASLKAFYLSQGATVEPATDDEVFAAEPAYRPAPPMPDYPAEIARLQRDIDQLRQANAALTKQLADLRKTKAKPNQ